MFVKLRRPCLQYILDPLDRYILQPLFVFVLSPLFGVLFAPLGTPLRRNLLSPLMRMFPGPSTKTEHAFVEPNEILLIITILTGPFFIAVISTIIFTISEDDKYLWQQKSNMNIWLYLGIFHTMLLWLLWRGASSLNFAPAVRLDRLTYSSRIGWKLQALIIIPWLYSLWKVTAFPLVALVLSRF